MQAGERDNSWHARVTHRAEQPQPGESGHGWAVRTLHDVQNHGWRHRYCGALCVRLCVAHSSPLLLFITYRDETCGSFKSRVTSSAKMMLGVAEVHWRLLYAGRPLADACKLSAYNIQLGGQCTVRAVPRVLFVQHYYLRRNTLKRWFVWVSHGRQHT